MREALEEKWPKAERGASQPAFLSAEALRPAGVQGARVRLRDLETPPDVAQEVRRHCAKLGLRRKDSRERRRAVTVNAKSCRD